MKTINSNQLSKITGGYSSHRRMPTTVLASVVQVSANPRDAVPNNDEYGDAASHCDQYSHKTVTPKNGDRNAQWQQYSWGTWWDDTN